MRGQVRLWCIAVALVGLIAAPGATAVRAQKTGATLVAAYESIPYGGKLSDSTGVGGGEDFTGAGFGPGELVSIYITFPDGRVFPVFNTFTDTEAPCCPRNDQILADGTGGFSFNLVMGPYYSYLDHLIFPSTTGSAPSGAQFTNRIFALPSEFQNAVPPIGTYIVTCIGRVSLQKATASFHVTGAPLEDFSRTTTGTLVVYTTIGHKTAAPQVDPQFATIAAPATFGGTVAANPNVDIACNGLIPGEFVTYWDTYPDGTVIGLSAIAADDGGSAIIQLDLLTGKFPTGLHTFSCRGSQSNYVLMGSFLLLPGGISGQSAIGALTVSYIGAPQAVANITFPQLPAFFASDYLLLTARNFRPNETVTLWQTFPDQTAHFIAPVKANTAGTAVVVIQLFPGPINYQVGRAILGDAALYQIAYPAGVDGRIPVGRNFFSARGDTTQRTASVPFDLLPSRVDP